MMFVGVCTSNINGIRHYPVLPASDMTSASQLRLRWNRGRTLTPAPFPRTFITNLCPSRVGQLVKICQPDIIYQNFTKSCHQTLYKESFREVVCTERLGWNLNGRETAARGDSEAVIAMVGGKMGGGGGLRPGRAFWAVARQREMGLLTALLIAANIETHHRDISSHWGMGCSVL